MTAPGNSPDIAIVGAGIAGFVFAIACRNAGINYTIYESGPKVWQHGSGIGMSINALQGLNLIDEQLAAAVKRVSSQHEQHLGDFHYRHGQDSATWKAFDTIQRLPTHGMKSIGRSEFVNEMVPYIPTDKLKFNKHLSTITQLPSGKVQLLFRDGTTAVHDLLVGCDGIHSRVRSYILGEDDPDGKPRFTGKICRRATIQTSEVLEIFGESSIETIQIFMGHHGHIVLLPVDGGKQVSITGTVSYKSWDHEKWVMDSTAEALRDDFSGWDDRLVQVLEKAGDTDIWALFDLPFPRTFVKGNVVILGDAAHASTPFQGNGTAMAIEDAYFLANLLAYADPESPKVLRKALETYDLYRKPRSQKQVHTAMEAGWIMDMESPRFGADVEAIKHLFTTRLHWLWHVNLKERLEEAINNMRSWPGE